MEQKHSGPGIASFVVSIAAGIMVFLLFGTAAALEAITPGGISEDSIGTVVLGLLVLGILFMELVALGLGIGGLFQKEHKKIFAILGTVFSAVTIAGIVLLMIIGSMA